MTHRLFPGLLLLVLPLAACASGPTAALPSAPDVLDDVEEPTSDQMSPDASAPGADVLDADVRAPRVDAASPDATSPTDVVDAACAWRLGETVALADDPSHGVVDVRAVDGRLWVVTRHNEPSLDGAPQVSFRLRVHGRDGAGVASSRTLVSFEGGAAWSLSRAVTATSGSRVGFLFGGASSCAFVAASATQSEPTRVVSGASCVALQDAGDGWRSLVSTTSGGGTRYTLQTWGANGAAAGSVAIDPGAEGARVFASLAGDTTAVIRYLGSPASVTAREFRLFDARGAALTPWRPLEVEGTEPSLYFRIEREGGELVARGMRASLGSPSALYVASLGATGDGTTLLGAATIPEEGGRYVAEASLPDAFAVLTNTSFFPTPEGAFAPALYVFQPRTLAAVARLRFPRTSTVPRVFAVRDELLVVDNSQADTPAPARGTWVRRCR